MDALYTLLVCAVTGERLQLLGAEQVAGLNARIAAGEARQRSGARADRPMDGGLLAQRSGYVYPIRSELPYLLPEDAIALPESGRP